MWTTDFFHLLFPKICACCGNSLWKQEQVICTWCLYRLPKTGFHLLENNPVSRIFWGRVRVEHAAAYLYFNRGNRVQQLIHQLKYKGRKDIGEFIGRQYGEQLRSVPSFQLADIIVPVPLHKGKERSRGYNQSERFAAGLASVLNIPVDSYTLFRSRDSATQTRRSRFSRWKNVSGIFHVTRKEKLQGSHVLLVDDVITTGATLEAASSALLQCQGLRVSIAAIATVRD